MRRSQTPPRCFPNPAECRARSRRNLLREFHSGICRHNSTLGGNPDVNIPRRPNPAASELSTVSTMHPEISIVRRPLPHNDAPGSSPQRCAGLFPTTMRRPLRATAHLNFPRPQIPSPQKPGDGQVHPTARSRYLCRRKFNPFRIDLQPKVTSQKPFWNAPFLVQ
jgi:hypothetical protein